MVSWNPRDVGSECLFSFLSLSTSPWSAVQLGHVEPQAPALDDPPALRARVPGREPKGSPWGLELHAYG